MAETPPVVQEFRAEVDFSSLVRTARTVARHLTALADDLENSPARDAFGPFPPIRPVPVDDGAVPPPGPRKFRYPFADPTRGEGVVPFTGPPALGERQGDFSGGGWVPLGVLGVEVRVWPSGDGVGLQYRATA